MTEERMYELEVEIRGSLYGIYFNSWPEGAEEELQEILMERVQRESKELL